jgi:hypothetical protein
MDWFAVNAKGWLQGTIRTQLTREERSVWIDLLAVASECRIRDGSLMHGKGSPMSRQYISDILQVPLELLNLVIEKCCQDPNLADEKHRIEIWEDGTIYITNFIKYQPDGVNRRPIMDARSREAAKVITTRRYLETPQGKAEAIDKLETSGYKVVEQ